MTSLEREDTRLGNTGPNAVRTVFEKIVFIAPTLRWCSFDFFFFFFESFEGRDERRPARKIRIFVSHTWKRKVDNFLLRNFHVDDI